jgi:arsenate reductase-like glutaredoxin family protein
LNSRNELYREQNMKDKPPTRAEALKLIAKHPNLLKRPLLVAGDRIGFGFDERTWKELID